MGYIYPWSRTMFVKYQSPLAPYRYISVELRYAYPALSHNPLLGWLLRIFFGRMEDCGNFFQENFKDALNNPGDVTDLQFGVQADNARPRAWSYAFSKLEKAVHSSHEGTPTSATAGTPCAYHYTLLRTLVYNDMDDAADSSSFDQPTSIDIQTQHVPFPRYLAYYSRSELTRAPWSGQAWTRTGSSACSQAIHSI
jgi:hypothetical protein